MKDYDDLSRITNKHTEICTKLDKCLKDEQNAYLVLLETEKQIRLKYWGDVVEKKMSATMLDAAVKNEAFAEKVEYEKCRTERRIVENQKDAVKEMLYSTKKTMGI